MTRAGVTPYLQFGGGGPAHAVHAVNGGLRDLARDQQRVVHEALPLRPLGGFSHAEEKLFAN